MMTKLSNEEKEILEAFQSGELRPVKNSKKIIEQHQEYAKDTLRKDPQKHGRYKRGSF
jgi:hypothetical protein